MDPHKDKSIRYTKGNQLSEEAKGGWDSLAVYILFKPQVIRSRGNSIKLRYDQAN